MAVEQWVATHLVELLGGAFVLGQVYWGFRGTHTRLDKLNGKVDRHEESLGHHGERIARLEARS